MVISELILLGLLAFIALFVMVFMMLFLRQSRHNEVMQKELLNVMLHARFTDKRADMEESLISLGRRFQENADDFSEVNHLPLRAQVLAEVSENSFLKSLGLDGTGIQENERQVFMLTPFSEAETETFVIVRNTLIESGFQVFRGDETKRTDVFSHIIKSMMESKLIIANLNGRNPNVMYELGVAHMLGKPVLLIAEMGDDISSIPFDLRTKNIVLYDSAQELREKIVKAVLQVI